MTQGKSDAATAAALSAAGVAWFDLFHQFLEWGVLIMGFISAAFALYFNIRKWKREMSSKSEQRKL